MTDAASAQELIAQGTGRVILPGSEATMVEQARAVAEVQASLVVARQNPRSEIRASERMRASCGNRHLADVAFFGYTRGGKHIGGGTIILVRELARCWGNVAYGVVELARDDLRGRSELLAYAWDLETNCRSSMGFINPHVRDTQSGPRNLRDMRDIYENNANAGARRVRECLKAVLPFHFVAEAENLCRETMQDGGGIPIEQRRANCMEGFARMGATAEQVQAKIGRPVDDWSDFDLMQLRILLGSLKRGETTLAQEFEADSAAEANRELRQNQARAEGEPISTHAPSAQMPPDDPPQGPAAAELAEDESPNAEQDQGRLVDETAAPHPDAEPEACPGQGAGGADRAQHALPDMPPEFKPKRKPLTDAEFNRVANASAKAQSIEHLRDWLNLDAQRETVARMTPDQVRSWDNHLRSLEKMLGAPFGEGADR